MSAIFKLFLLDVAILVAGIVSTIIMKDATGLVFCGFIFFVISAELNSELVNLEDYIEEMEEVYYE